MSEEINNKQEQYLDEALEDEFVIVNNVDNNLNKVKVTQLKFNEKYNALQEVSESDCSEETYSDNEQDITDEEDYDNFDNLKHDFPILRLGDYKTKCDLQLSNKIVNDLRRFSNHKHDRKYVLNSKRDHTMAELCVTQLVDSLLDKMVNITGVIHSDKDAVIFHAYSNPSYTHHSLPKECAVKVPKTILQEFKQWEKFIKEDHYFKDKFKKQVTRKNLLKKIQKEKDILMRLQEIGIKCPRVITLKNGILVTTFIGKNKKIACSVKDANLTSTEYREVYNDIIRSIEKMYKANLVHGGFLEHNVLWHNRTCYFVNVHNCVERSDKKSFHCLYRDCSNLYHYFHKKNEFLFWSPGDLFYDITRCHYKDKVALRILRQSFK